ncbi:MAG: YicC family protein [Phycisphaeraceae bacterium]|nr:YicC family protein [Phycisphaeraceae bacterium]MCB9848874.1 YicC family protein [Phycisphaeraceae bacterium]
MIRSMTGFGEASAHIDGAHYFLEARSLNNKYFKASIRLPDDLQGLEAPLEAILRRRLARGAITVTAKCSDTSESAAYEINCEALSSYIDQLGKLRQIVSGQATFDAGALLDLPGVLQAPADNQAAHDRARHALSDLLNAALNDLIAMRQTEGEALAQELMKHHDVIVDRLGIISERAPQVVEEYHQRLRSRVEKMLQSVGATVEPGDLIREVAIYAERSDIAEEIARLSGHMEQFRQLVTGDSEEPIGRTLEFLAQEMLREANTLASKSSDADLSRCAVEIKGAIDRIKEQVQNAE